DGIRDRNVTGVQTCALPICISGHGNITQKLNIWPRQGAIFRHIGDYKAAASCCVEAFKYFPQVATIRDPAIAAGTPLVIDIANRSEERRVGKERASRRGRGE